MLIGCHDYKCLLVRQTSSVIDYFSTLYFRSRNSLALLVCFCFIVQASGTLVVGLYSAPLTINNVQVWVNQALREGCGRPGTNERETAFFEKEAREKVSGGSRNTSSQSER